MASLQKNGNHNQIFNPTLSHRSSVMTGNSAPENPQESMSTLRSRLELDAKRDYVRAWCACHRLSPTLLPRIDGFDRYTFGQLVPLYIFDMLQLHGGLEERGLVHVWNDFIQNGFHPTQVVGNLNPILHPELFAVRWKLGDRQWSEQEKLYGRQPDINIDDNLSSIHSDEDQDYPDALPPDRRNRQKYGSHEDAKRRSHGAARMRARSSDSYESSSSSMSERNENNAHHREYKEQRRSSLNTSSSSSRTDRYTPARGHEHDARSSANSHRSERIPVPKRSSQDSFSFDLNSREGMEAFERFGQEYNLPFQRYAELKRSLADDANITSGGSSQRDDQQPLHQSQTNASSAQVNTATDHSVLGVSGISGLGSMQPSSVVVMQSTGAGGITCDRFPNSTKPSEMQLWAEKWRHYRDSIGYSGQVSRASHPYKFIKSDSMTNLRSMYICGKILYWSHGN